MGNNIRHGEKHVSIQKDWAGDYDLFDAEYVSDPYAIWDELRGTCPVAHTERYGGSWLTTTYDDVTTVARDPQHFSSRNVSVIPPPDDTEASLLPAGLPRMELTVAIEEWLARIPTFHLEEGGQVAWAAGQVRGPRLLPVVFP